VPGGYELGRRTGRADRLTAENLTAELSHHDSRPAPVVTVRTGRTLDGPISECDPVVRSSRFGFWAERGVVSGPGKVAGRTVYTPPGVP